MRERSRRMKIFNIFFLIIAAIALFYTLYYDSAETFTQSLWIISGMIWCFNQGWLTK